MKSKQPSEQSQEGPFADGLVEHIKDLMSNIAQGDNPWEILKMYGVFEQVKGISDAERKEILMHINNLTISTYRKKLRIKLAEYVTGNIEDITTILGNIERLDKPENPLFTNQFYKAKYISPKKPFPDDDNKNRQLRKLIIGSINDQFANKGISPDNP